MSVEFIAGVPGSGKTLFAMGLLETELTTTNRKIVTNMPIRMRELGVYLRTHYPALDIRLDERIKLLSEDELPEFYLWRGPDYKLGVVTEMPVEDNRIKVKRTIRPLLTDIREGDCGVQYYLDELHIAFGNREWQNTAPAALYYLSQHRKLSDDVICITQAVSNVDKKFASVAGEFHQIRNHTVERWGWFNGPASFTVKTYLRQPKSPTDVPMHTRRFKLRRELASCYDTAAGVGVVGRAGADTKKTRKGIPLWTAWLAFAAVAVLVISAPWLLFGGAKKLVTEPVVALVGKPPTAAAAPAASPAPEAGAKQGRGPASDTSSQAEQPPSTAGSVPPSQTYALGYAAGPRGLRVTLSDGTILTETDGVARVTASHVLMNDGKKIYFKH